MVEKIFSVITLCLAVSLLASEIFIRRGLEKTPDVMD